MSKVAAAIIDGTGEWSDKGYAHSMQNSFCSQLAQATELDSHYESGPSGEGYRIRERAARGVDFLKNRAASACCWRATAVEARSR